MRVALDSGADRPVPSEMARFQDEQAEREMIDSLISTPTIRMLEQTLSFTEQRHQVLLEDIANASTPGYVQRDLSVDEFQGALRDAVDRQRRSMADAYEPESGETVAFEPGGSRLSTRSAEK